MDFMKNFIQDEMKDEWIGCQILSLVRIFFVVHIF